MDFIEQVGTRYLEGKANAAPKQLEDFAKKQFFGSHEEGGKGKSRTGNVSPQGEDRAHDEHGENVEHEEYEERGHTSTKSAGKKKLEHEAISEKDLEIARLRGELEESRRGAARKVSRAPSKKGEEHRASTVKESPARQLRKSRSTKVFDNKGIKVVGGALVADAASRRHREKRPEHNATREIGKTIDGKGLGVAGGALVAERGNKASSKSEHAAREPIIVEAAPRPRPRERSLYEVEDDYEEEDDNDGKSGYGSVAHSTLSRRRQRPTRQRSREEDEHEHGSDHGSVAHSIVSRRTRKPSLEDPYSEHGGIAPSPASHGHHRSFAEPSDHHSIAPSRASTRRRSSPERSEIGSIAAPPSRRKSILSSRPRRPSTESSLGSVIAPSAQVEAIRRRQRSRGRGLTDAEIDTPAPETPSLRALSGRRREMETRHERGGWGEGEEEAVHLPERRKSVLHERVRGDEGGSVIDVLEARSVPFRPHRERGQGGRYEEEKERERAKQRQRQRDTVEVVEEKARQREGPVVRRIERGNPDGRRSEVELMRREGGRTVYRVR